jgi:transcriptional regulator with XRE-family HTH domain
LTQSELAERVGTKRSVITEIENGARKVSLDWLWHVAQELDIDPHELDARLASDGRGLPK